MQYAPSCRRSSSLVAIFLLTILGSLTNSPAMGQTEDADEKASGRVIGRIWHAKADMGKMMQYTFELSKELGLKQSPIMAMIGGGGGGIMGNVFGGPPAKGSVKGSLIFLETAPKPGALRYISFQKVKDLKEFQRLVRQRADAMGPVGELLGEDDRFEVKLSLRPMKVTAEPRGADGGTEPEKRVIALEFRSEIQLDSDGPSTDFVMPSSFSTFYRYHDGMMYSGQLKALHHVDLPSQDSFHIEGEPASQDIYGTFDFTKIPMPLKQQVWLALQAKTQTYMQKFDNEALGDHSVRHVLGQGRLEILKAAMFDVDTAEFSVKFAEADETAVKASLSVVAREDSQLAKSLRQLNRTPSRLGALRNNESPLVVSTSLDIPDWSLPLATEFVDSLQKKMLESIDDASVQKLVSELFLPIATAAKEGQLDAAVRMEGSFDDGMVLAGGLRLPEAEQFHSTLETLLLVQSASGRFSAGRSTVGEIDAITLGFEDLQLPFMKEKVPVQLHLAGSGSYVWFSLGGTNSLDSLKSHLGNQAAVLDSQTESMPLLVRLRLSEWMGKEADGASRIPYMAVVGLERAINNLLSPMFNFRVSMNGSNIKPRKAEFTSFAEKLLKGKSGDVELAARTFGRSFSVNASIGTGVAKFFVAQYAAAQNRMFQNINFQPIGNAAGGGQVRSIRIGN